MFIKVNVKIRKGDNFIATLINLTRVDSVYEDGGKTYIHRIHSDRDGCFISNQPLEEIEKLIKEAKNVI